MPGAGEGPHRQDLVGAHAKMPVSQELVLPLGQVQAPTGLVEHHKVIARALHFGEADSHGPDYGPVGGAAVLPCR